MADSIITDVFQGQFYTKVQCADCHYDNISFDNFLSLSLSFPNGESSISLKKCLDEFIREEHISKKEGYKCDKCKNIVDITKQTTIWRLPPVLIIHLKRFHCLGRRKQKLETSIKFDVTGCNLRPYCGYSGNFYYN